MRTSTNKNGQTNINETRPVTASTPLIQLGLNYLPVIRFSDRVVISPHPSPLTPSGADNSTATLSGKYMHPGTDIRHNPNQTNTETHRKFVK